MTEETVVVVVDDDENQPLVQVCGSSRRWPNSAVGGYTGLLLVVERPLLIPLNVRWDVGHGVGKEGATANGRAGDGGRPGILGGLGLKRVEFELGGKVAVFCRLWVGALSGRCSRRNLTHAYTHAHMLTLRLDHTVHACPVCTHALPFFIISTSTKASDGANPNPSLLMET